MDNIKFTVENKDFFVPENFAEIDSYTIKSVPRPYPVKWDNSKTPFESVNKLMQENPNNLLLIDKNVFELYGKNLQFSESRIFKAEATEEFKTIDGVLKLIEFLEQNKFTKGETLIVVGGGIVQDIGAFVGACFKRGIRWIYFPTTLLSMSDSCIGGKTGINHNNAKNQLALFSAPAKVIINPEFLKTLDDKDIKSGIGEILKLHITGGKKFVESYNKYVNKGTVINFEAYKPLILGALAVKRAIVEEDEFELNHRRSLNYGHTIGHAVEVLSEYTIPHGLAVVIGVIVVNQISANRALLDKEENEALKQISLDLLEKNMFKNIPTDELRGLLKKDKKTIGNTVNFAVIKTAGDTLFLPEEVNDSLLSEISEIIKEAFYA